MKNILLLIAAIAIIFVIGEVSINAYDTIVGRSHCALSDEVMDFRGWRFDDMLNRVHIPGLKFTYAALDGREFRNVVEYSAKGLRDHDYPYEKQANVTRILVFGDSFVEALQVKQEDNFCKRLEKLLNESGGPDRFEVINMGVSGYSPMLEYLYLKYEGMKYSPDIVLACFFMNDVYEDSCYKGLASFGPDGLPTAVRAQGVDKIKKVKGFKKAGRIVSGAFKRIVNKSRFYVFIKKRVYRLLARYGMKEKEDKKNQFFVLTQKPGQEEIEMWRDSFRYIRAMKELSESGGARFLLTIMPVEPQITASTESASFRAYFTQTPDSGAVNALIDRFCAENDIQRLQLYNVFRTKKDEGLYFKNDGHLTPRGHSVTADALLQRFIDLGWATKG